MPGILLSSLSVQFSRSVMSDFCDPMNRSTPGLPVDPYNTLWDKYCCTIIILILQRRKLRHREVNDLYTTAFLKRIKSYLTLLFKKWLLPDVFLHIYIK